MEQLTKEQALNNLITAANQGRYSLQEADAVKESIQVMVNALSQVDSFYAIKHAEKQVREEIVTKSESDAAQKDQ